MKKNKSRQIALMGAFAMVPFLFAIPPALGWFAGQWLDEKWETSPLFQFLLIAFGFAAGIREVYKIIRRFGEF